VLSPGSSIAGYVVEDVVDARGLGVVYKARQLRLDRPVALKLVDAQEASDPLVRERLRREARTVASLDHPNVVPLYEAGEEGGTVFIATRWVEGTELGELIRRDQPLRPRRAARLAAQIAAALEVAHEQELIHRDIKPSTLLVTAEDHVYITDFGLTKRAQSLSGFTVAAQMLGTIDYVAPEQIEGGEAGPHGDVYGLACVTFEMLSGFAPFARESGQTAKMWAHLNAPPPSVREQRPDVPAALDDAIRAGLSKRPDDRPSAAVFGAAVLRAVGESP
jgi:serine/threonine protein kinase